MTNSIQHPLTDKDRSVVATIRQLVGAQPPLVFGPAARPGFDALMEHSPPAPGVRYEEARVGGVPGWWVIPESAGTDQVLLYFFGGGYVIGSAAANRNFVGHIAQRAGQPAFIADYRRAPEHPFPAAADDARAALDGLAPARVTLVGASAGGGLALGLAQATGRPAVVLSPWADLTMSQAEAVDDPLLSRAQLAGAAQLYAGEHDRRDARLSPLWGTAQPPVLLHAGAGEFLLDDSLRYAARNPRAELHVWEGMLHVFPATVGLDAAQAALDSIGQFIRAHA